VSLAAYRDLLTTEQRVSAVYQARDDQFCTSVRKSMKTWIGLLIRNRGLTDPLVAVGCHCRLPCMPCELRLCDCRMASQPAGEKIVFHRYMQAWEELSQDIQQLPGSTEVKATADPEATKSEAGEKAAGDEEQKTDGTAGQGAEGEATDVQQKQAAIEPAAGGNDPTEPNAREGNDQESSDPANFSALISSEVKDLKDSKKRPFVPHETGIKTCMFLHMPLVSEHTPSPTQVRDSCVLQARVLCQLIMSRPSWEDVQLSRGTARPGSNPGPAERHLSSFIRAAR
jgi:hypothetical protein